MRQFLVQVIGFPLLFVALFIAGLHLSTLLVKSRDFRISETDSNTLVMGKNTHYDIIFSGASHARVLSRDGNHYRMENILDMSIANIGQGAATCGVQEQYFYLKYFYDENNTAEKLVYLLSPGLLFSEMLPIASNTFNEECFSYRFLFRYMRFEFSENKRQRIFEYIRSKYSSDWLFLKPKRNEAMKKVLEEVAPNAAIEGASHYYSVDKSMDRFEISSRLIEDEVQYVENKGSEVVFILPPAVFGKWPGHEITLEFAYEMRDKYGIEVYDFSESIMDKKFYYDHHHLNSAGVAFFAENYLSPALK